MSNEELIALLQKLPAKARVVVNMDKNDLANGKEVRFVHTTDAVFSSFRYYGAETYDTDTEIVINITS